MEIPNGIGPDDDNNYGVLWYDNSTVFPEGPWVPLKHREGHYLVHRTTFLVLDVNLSRQGFLNRKTIEMIRTENFDGAAYCRGHGAGGDSGNSDTGSEDDEGDRRDGSWEPGDES